MNKNIINKLIICLGMTLAGIIPAKAQQNIQFTQYIFNSLSVNPAYAGYKEDWYAQGVYRTQWEGLSGAPKTMQFSVDGIVDPATKNMGLGLLVASDKLGPLTYTSAYANYAYRLRLDAQNTKRLSFGLGVGVTNEGLDGVKLTGLDKTDLLMPLGRETTLLPDARAGVYLSTPKFYVGASLMNLFEDLVGGKSAYNLNYKRHLYLMAGMLNELSEDVKLRPSILLKDDFRGPSSVDLNAMFIFMDKLWLGGSYRTGLKVFNRTYSDDLNLDHNNAASAVAQFHVNNSFRIGYSYDFMTNGLSNVQNGSHEITVGLTFQGKSKRIISPRYF